MTPATGSRLPLVPPAGMRDLLHPHATRRRALARALVERFAAHGYDLVVTPPFEHAEVLERGLGPLDRRDLLRFVEPESGEVALLRPDVTPQIARLVATHLRDRPGPWRLAYEGSVVRRARGRMHRTVQIAQAGVECIGLPSPLGDVEVVALASRCVEAVGLGEHRVELSDVRIASSVLDELPEALRDAAAQALDRRDAAALERLAREARCHAALRRALPWLCEAQGGREVLDRARRTPPRPAWKTALDALTDLWDELDAEGLGDRLLVDLGEVRGAAYYTGPSFRLLAEGPSGPVGAGGRYDELLPRFGLEAPATGFALDLDALEQALEHAGTARPLSVPVRIAVGGRGRLEPFARTLREVGATVAALPLEEPRQALAFAQAWGYDAVVVLGGDAVRATRVRDGARRTWSAGRLRPVALCAWACGRTVEA
ncbi:MAG: ATP phosphoribosyltransferase regulatory subunit [Myxococcota bacterium]|nr:ATP phosphoribosyltransferase regulatory subunit [Myxococcota bacterium]MDW8362543.1 ATP phosphoribosyltransferase regulatory subunit [Myxococcales bacterium]